MDMSETLTGSPSFAGFVYIGDANYSISNIPQGTDNEDGSISTGDSIHITALPDSTNKLFYNGVEIEFGEDGVNPPSASNPFIISNFNPDSLKFQLFCCETASFDYTVIDAAGAIDATPATFEINWLGPVPVDFVDVTARLIEDGQVLVQWTTAMELNNDRFEIERMLDNETSFSKIGEIGGSGNSTQLLQYSYFDVDLPVSAKRAFYRIKQIDFDGQSDYSEIASVDLHNKTQMHTAINPNPASGHITVSVEDTKDFGMVEIMGLDGSVILSQELSKETTITINQLTPGLYFVRWSNGSDVETHKLRVQ
jgi:hypothetical protein